MLNAAELLLGAAFTKVPVVTTTFNTGYIESASILVSVAAALESLAREESLWPQRTGLPELDQRPRQALSDIVLAIGSSDVGFNFAVVLRRGWRA